MARPDRAVDRILSTTTMWRSLPPEIFDLIVDLLCDEPTTLKMCCVASKSWVPRTRRHLFARVELDTLGPPIESWMKAFPDPSNSPAHHTRALTIRGTRSVIAAGADVDRWIRAFHNVVHLHLDILGWSNDQASFAPFHGLSPTVRSLHLSFTSVPPSEVFGLLCSFPLLEGFTLLAFSHKDEVEGCTAPSSPRLTGSLGLRILAEGISHTARRLLCLPNGLHFTRIELLCVCEADFKSTTDLVSECSDTLEHLDVADGFSGVFPLPLLLIDA